MSHSYIPAEHPGFTQPLLFLIAGVIVLCVGVIVSDETGSVGVAVIGGAIGAALAVAGVVEGGLRLRTALSEVDGEGSE